MMNKVIKAFEKFNDELQETIYELYSNGDLEKATFPFKGELAEGVIYDDEENMYLIPTSTIKASKLGTADDDDDDDDDGDDLEEEVIDVDDSDDDSEEDDD